MPSDDSPSAEVKHCTACHKSFEIGGEDDTADVLEHWAKEHSDSEVFWNILDDYHTHTRCGCCGNFFASEIRPVTAPDEGKEALVVDLYCNDCVKHEQVPKIKSLMVEDVTGRYVLDNSVEVDDAE